MQLILRTGRQLELTHPGTLLLQRAHSLLRQLAQAAADVRAESTQITGSLAIGVSPATCEALGPAVVRACARLHPGLQLNFVEAFSGYIFERLVNQELALCITHNPPRQREIEVEALIEEPMYLVGPAASRDGLAPAEPGMALSGLPLVLPNRTHSLRMLIERALAPLKREIQVSVQVDGYTMTKALVAAGAGYTVLPLSAVAPQVAAGQLSAVRLHDPEISWTLSLAYRVDRRSGRAVNAVCGIIRAEARKLMVTIPEAVAPA